MTVYRNMRADKKVQEASEESFPASDPPGWIPASTGPRRSRGSADADSLEALIRGLNEDLAAELGTIIRYNYQAGKVYGPIGEHLREIFRSEVTDELGHAAFLTEIIVDLGGEPTTTPAGFEKPETLREMLELDLELEYADVERYIEHARVAEELGEIEIQLKLEEIAADESRHARQIQRLLRGI